MESTQKNKVELAKLKAENKKLKRLLLSTANHLKVMTDNVEGSVGSCNSDSYAKDYYDAIKFLNKHFQS